MPTVKPEEYVRRQVEIAGWNVNCVSYRLGDRFYCAIDNVDPGARVARGQGATREEAEQTALEKASRYLGQTRRFDVKS